MELSDEVSRGNFGSASRSGLGELAVPSLLMGIMLVLFIALALAIAGTFILPFPVLAAMAILFGLSGGAVVISAARLQNRAVKRLLILAGISAVAIPCCAILHNVVYGLCKTWFGPDFWGRNGDEPVFFILSVVVFPALWLIGTIGSGLLMLKAVIRGKAAKPPDDGSGKLKQPPQVG